MLKLTQLAGFGKRKATGWVNGGLWPGATAAWDATRNDTVLDGSGNPCGYLSRVATWRDIATGTHDMTQATNGSRPYYLDWAGENYLHSPGAGTSCTAPHNAATNLGGDRTIECKLQLVDWTPPGTSGATVFVGRYTSTFCYNFGINSTGQLFASIGAFNFTANASVPFADNTVGYVRVRYTQNNGTQHQAIFETSTNGSSWTQLGATQFVAGTGASTTGTAETTIGYQVGGYFVVGKIFRARISNDDTATNWVFDFNPGTAKHAATTVTDAIAGMVFTLGPATAISPVMLVGCGCMYCDTGQQMEIANPFGLAGAWAWAVAMRHYGNTGSFSVYCPSIGNTTTNGAPIGPQTVGNEVYASNNPAYIGKGGRTLTKVKRWVIGQTAGAASSFCIDDDVAATSLTVGANSPAGTTVNRGFRAGTRYMLGHVVRIGVWETDPPLVPLQNWLNSALGEPLIAYP